MTNKLAKYLYAVIGFMCGAALFYPTYEAKYYEALQAKGMLSALGYDFYDKDYSGDKKVCIWVQTRY